MAAGRRHGRPVGHEEVRGCRPSPDVGMAEHHSAPWCSLTGLAPHAQAGGGMAWWRASRPRTPSQPAALAPSPLRHAMQCASQAVHAASPHGSTFPDRQAAWRRPGGRPSGASNGAPRSTGGGGRHPPRRSPSLPPRALRRAQTRLLVSPWCLSMQREGGGDRGAQKAKPFGALRWACCAHAGRCAAPQGCPASRQPTLPPLLGGLGAEGAAEGVAQPRMSVLLRLRGLPFSCTEEEVMGFFEGSGTAVAVHLSTKNGEGGGARGPQLRGRAGGARPRAPQVGRARMGAATAAHPPALRFHIPQASARARATPSSRPQRTRRRPWRRSSTPTCPRAT